MSALSMLPAIAASGGLQRRRTGGAGEELLAAEMTTLEPEDEPSGVGGGDHAG